MRRFVLLLFFAGTAIVLAAGIAFAVTKECDGECSGTGMADRLLGSAGVDIIHALDGHDKVFDREDDDWLKGGPGDDEVHGRMGNDLVRGGTAKQTDEGDADRLDCGAGHEDIVYYTPGDDEITNCEIENP